ncbi:MULTISPECIES: pirin family protein [Pseudonocardia]|uniref:pirin family protein n=1 Tax=Pseudonocardia TaxID=1847 RepID=UPI0020982A0D|nr:pirin family protein [Pseudonocardia sp. McavD-2-B]MCO7193055.1 pirin family protein [Pseudonocardia sp. McavD-2-B]
MDAPTGHVTLYRAGSRARTETGWLDSRHSFSAGAHYDPANTHFGLLLLHNEDRLVPGRGYDEHPHRDTEILTWVLDGELEHRDSTTGRTARVGPGGVQYLGAGSGVRHSEHATPDGGVRFVQMWVVPEEPGGDPRHLVRAAHAGERGDTVVLASGLARHRESTLLPLRQRAAALSVARLAPGAATELPTAPFVHAFVARGGATLEDVPGDELGTGDAARVVDDGGRRITAGPDGAEILVWEMHAALGW